MKNLFMRLLLSGAVIMLMPYLFDGVYVKDFITAVLVALVLSFLNSFVKPILKFLTFPINFLSLGLFSLVINGFILNICTSILSPDFYIESFGLMIIVSIVISIFNSFLGLNKHA